MAAAVAVVCDRTVIEQAAGHGPHPVAGGGRCPGFLPFVVDQAPASGDACECERWRDGVTVCPVHGTKRPGDRGQDGPLLASVRADLAELDCSGGVRGSLRAMALWLAERMDGMGADRGASTVARLAQELRATMQAIAAPRQGGEGQAMQDLLARLGTPAAGGPTAGELAAVAGFTKRIAAAMDDSDPATMRDVAIELRDELALAVAGRRVDGA